MMKSEVRAAYERAIEIFQKRYIEINEEIKGILTDHPNGFDGWLVCDCENQLARCNAEKAFVEYDIETFEKILKDDE